MVRGGGKSPHGKVSYGETKMRGLSDGVVRHGRGKRGRQSKERSYNSQRDDGGCGGIPAARSII